MLEEEEAFPSYVFIEKEANQAIPLLLTQPRS